MPRYSVIVTRDATESVTVEVVTRDEAEAEAKALEMDHSGWTLDDCNFHQPYTNGADLIEGPEYRNRANLMSCREWWDMDIDSSGNPLVWMNYYRDEKGMEWEEPWSCQCDDDGYEPYESEWIGPSDPAEILLWESLPDAN